MGQEERKVREGSERKPWNSFFQRKKMSASSFTSAAINYLEPELEYRTRFLVQEARKVCHQSHAPCRVLEPSHLLAARSIIRAGHGSHGSSNEWIQHPGSSAARLVTSSILLPLPFSDADSKVDSATSQSSSREAAALLAAITAAVSDYGDNDEDKDRGNNSVSGVALLLAQLGAREAEKLEFLIPRIVSVLRLSAEDSLVENVAATAALNAVAHMNSSLKNNNPRVIAARLHSSYKRLRRVVSLFSALSANDCLTIDNSIGEILAALCSILLNNPKRLGGSFPHDTSILQQQQPKVQGKTQSSASSLAEVISQLKVLRDDEIHLRSYAAQVLGALLTRIAPRWPALIPQTTGALLDAMSSSIEMSVAASESTGSSATMTMEPRISKVISYECLYGSAIGLSSIPQNSDSPTSLLAIKLTSTLLNAIKSHQIVLEEMKLSTPDSMSLVTISRSWCVSCLQALEKGVVATRRGQVSESINGDLLMF